MVFTPIGFRQSLLSLASWSSFELGNGTISEIILHRFPFPMQMKQIYIDFTVSCWWNERFCRIMNTFLGHRISVTNINISSLISGMQNEIKPTHEPVNYKRLNVSHTLSFCTWYTPNFFSSKLGYIMYDLMIHWEPGAVSSVDFVSVSLSNSLSVLSYVLSSVHLHFQPLTTPHWVQHISLVGCHKNPKTFLLRLNTFFRLIYDFSTPDQLGAPGILICIYSN